MKVTPKPLLCRLWGHSLCEEAAYYYAVFNCKRCDRDNVGDETGLREWLMVRFWLLRYNLKRRYANWRWWLTCGDCGQHFGKHDDTQDHIPF